MGNGSIAILVINLATEAQDFKLPLADIPGLTCAATTSPTSRTAGGDAGGGGSCTVRDVWAQQDRPRVQTSLRMQLREHESGFFVLGPAADETVPTTE